MAVAKAAGGGAGLVDGGARGGGAAGVPEARAQTATPAATWRAPELTVVIPTLNERENVPLLAARLGEVLKGVAWEAIFVDDDSTDGTIDIIRRLSEASPHIRGIRRVHRRGLAGASLEGMLASSAQFVAVMDGDLQHDEQCLTDMLRILRKGEADVVVGSRYLEGPGESGLTRTRHLGSRLATRLAKPILHSELSDPMSGFFMIRREAVETVAPALSHQGFKILLDILASSGTPLRVSEVPFEFRERLHGESKLDAAVVLEYLGLIVAKLSRDLVSIRFLMFGSVGATGVVVNLVVLALLLDRNVGFSAAQTTAMLVADDVELHLEQLAHLPRPATARLAVPHRPRHVRRALQRRRHSRRRRVDLHLCGTALVGRRPCRRGGRHDVELHHQHDDYLAHPLNPSRQDR